MERFASAVLLLALLLPAPARAQPSQTIGLFLNDPGAFPGYTLFTPLEYPETYLIDNAGELVHSWSLGHPISNMAYLLPDGNLLAPVDPGGTSFVMGGDGGAVHLMDWDGNLLWEYEYSDSTVRLHHDIELLPNGNVLMIAWEYKSYAECVAAGRDELLITSNELWPDHLIEVQPTLPSGGTIVWEWHAWDHLIQDYASDQDNFGVVADHPELIDINYMQNPLADWLHFNAVDYNPELDLIAVSSPRFSEIWILDHSTTTAEAAGHAGGARGRGGDLLYRWGNPEAYDRGTPADRRLYRQHDIHWIPTGQGLPGEGRLMVFNNGNTRPEGPFSSVDEIATPDSAGFFPALGPGETHAPATATWTYPSVFDPTFYSGFVSGAQRLPNGNTLIMEGATGTTFEVDTTETKVWEYVVPVNDNGPNYQYWAPGLNRTFRSHRYAITYPAFTGRDLTPQGVIELDPTPVAVLPPADRPLLQPGAPNPFFDRTRLTFSVPRDGTVRLEVFDVRGRRVAQLVNGTRTAGLHTVDWVAGDLAPGVYQVRLRTGAESSSQRVVHLR